MTPGAITRYRVLALTTGVMLLILTFVVIPLQLWAHNTVLVKPVSLIHGYGYMVYLVVALDLSLRARFSPVRTILILLAGTVPFAAFYFERVVVREAKTKLVMKKPGKSGEKKVTQQQAAPAPEPAPASAE
jgi:integral membrane protein